MKIFQRGDTYIAPKGAYFDGHVRINGNFITPPDTHFWGNLEVGGRLELGPGSSVGSQILAQSAIIGPRVKVQGPLIVLENLVVCDKSILQSIQAGGNVLLRPGVTVGDVKSDETITVVGKIQSGQLVGRNVKIFAN
ncbi:MAG: polymer-forming cytoskeletal protein [Methanomicrobiales archaeon]|nr:polymer-forming cytoskeletal protein [Methanomicrobiales archaeon]